MLIDGQKQEIVWKSPNKKVSPTGETFLCYSSVSDVVSFSVVSTTSTISSSTSSGYTTAIVTTLAPSSILIKRTPNVARPV